MISKASRSAFKILLSGGTMIVALLTVWVGMLIVRNHLLFEERGERPRYTNATRMAVKEVVSVCLKPAYDLVLRRRSELPAYSLEMSPRRLEKLRQSLREAQEKGRGGDNDGEGLTYLEAEFHAGDSSWEVDVRPRGQLLDHYSMGKPSLRVRFPKDRLFRGVRSMNLIIPYDKLWTDEINFIARQYGLLTYPRRHVLVELNGRLLGVYQEIEHFTEELAVKQGRAEGFFFNGQGEEKGGDDGLANAGAVEALQALTACQNGCSAAGARSLLDRFLDEPRMAVFAALTTLFGSAHAWGPDNLMLFFDPGRGRLEPIPWDVGIWPLPEPSSGGPPEIATGVGDALLQDDQFRHARNVYLWEILESWVGPMRANAEREFSALRDVLAFDVEHSRAFTDYTYARFEELIERGAFRWGQELRAARLRVVVGRDGIAVSNEGLSEVELRALSVQDESGNVVAMPLSLRLPGRYRDRILTRSVSLAAGVRPQRVLTAVNTVTGESIPEEAVEWSSVETEVVTLLPEEVPAAPPELAGLTIERDQPPLWALSGKVTLRDDLVLPRGVDLRFEPGLRLRLAPSASLVVQGDLVSKGSREAPVRVESLEQGVPFGSLVVRGRRERPARVELRHTVIRGGSEADHDGAHMSGALSIYDGSLTAEHLVIVETAGEDGINVKHGRVELRHLTLHESASDGIDLDFCTGFVRDSTFTTSGGDGLDLSGSEIVIAGNVFRGFGDKGISIGEESRVSVHANRITGGVTGIAVKDGSVATLKDNVLSDLEVGVAVYQKKPVFGSGVVTYSTGQMVRVESSFLTDPGARIVQP